MLAVNISILPCPCSSRSLSTAPESSPSLTAGYHVERQEATCIGNSCPEVTSFNAQFDSGTSFTFLLGHAYEAIAKEFDKQVNATRSTFQGSFWEYCYVPSSQQLPKVPTLTLMFQQNNSFVVYNPVFVYYNKQGIDGFCLAIQPTEGDMGTMGQNFMMGYRLVFDRENKKLAWSRSNCQDLSLGKKMPLSPPNKTPSNPLLVFRVGLKFMLLFTINRMHLKLRLVSLC